MTDRESIRVAALKLPASERAELAEALLASLDEDLPARGDDDGELLYEDEWVAECERRRKAIESGEMKTFDAEDLIRRLQAGEMP